MSMDNAGDSVRPNLPIGISAESGQNWINQNAMKTEQTRK